MGRYFAPRWVAAILITLFISLAAAQSTSPTRDLDVVQVRPNVWMIAGAGGNITVHTGEQGIVLVDSGTAALAPKVLAVLKTLSTGKVRYMINTGADADHVGGNGAIARAGLSLYPQTGFGGGGLTDAVTNSGGAAILAHDNVNLRMSGLHGKQALFTVSDRPTETFTGNIKSLYLNDDGIQAIHLPNGHSDADLVVFFRRADVIATGDIFDEAHFPVIDIENGGRIQGEIAALNRLLELAIPPVPLVWLEGRTMIIPGHGRLADHADLTEYRDMLTIIRDRVQNMIDSGLTLEQIKKADPTQGYRARWGSDTGPWTTDKFVEAVYKSLITKR